MREILFRGKDVCNDEWIEGDLSHNFFHTGDICITGTQGDYQVIPDTVGQYTGLRDENGKKIFEDDIVVYENGRCQAKKTTIGKVAEYKGAFGIIYKGDRNFLPFVEMTIYVLGVEVIGNIHDNPELLIKGIKAEKE